ncbi:MAG: hypothetical protein ABIA63_02990 [bacterium]
MGKYNCRWALRSFALDDLYGINNILSVLQRNKPAVFGFQFNITPVKLFHGKGLFILKDPLITRINFVKYKAGLGITEIKFVSNLAEMVFVNLKGLPDKGTIKLGKI